MVKELANTRDARAQAASLNAKLNKVDQELGRVRSRAGGVTTPEDVPKSVNATGLPSFAEWTSATTKVPELTWPSTRAYHALSCVVSTVICIVKRLTSKEVGCLFGRRIVRPSRIDQSRRLTAGGGCIPCVGYLAP